MPPSSTVDPGGVQSVQPVSGPPKAPHTVPAPTPAPAAPPVAPPVSEPEPVLIGTGVTVRPVGVGLQRTVTLVVTEPLAAFEAELRLDRAGAAGAMAWSTLPGARVTVHQEGGAVVYRFAAPPGKDLRPGSYTFTVQEVRAAVPSTVGAKDRWTASGFATRQPRAVAAHGAFAP